MRLIRPRKRILIGSGAAEPCGLVEAMVTHGTHLEGNEVVHLMTLGSAPYVQPGLAGPFRHMAFFIGANVRAAVDTAELILAEVNPNMPRTLGDSFLHVDRIAQLVAVDVPLPERAPEPLYISISS